MINSKFRHLHIASILLFIIPCFLFASSLSGIVENSQTQKPLSEVIVEIEGADQSTITNSYGIFTFDSITSGSWNLHFFHQNFEPLKINDIFISGNTDKKIETELNPVLYSLDNLIIHGKSFRRPPDMSSSTKIMNFDEILHSPGALLDVQRAVQNLPSVTSGSDNTNEIIVRGSSPGENLLIMDNIEIPNPNHFANQGSGGGVISLINPLLVKKITFCAGAPPAQYGGKASSVLDIKLKKVTTRLYLVVLILAWRVQDFIQKALFGRAQHLWHQLQKAILTCLQKLQNQQHSRNTGEYRQKSHKHLKTINYTGI